MGISSRKSDRGHVRNSGESSSGSPLAGEYGTRGGNKPGKRCIRGNISGSNRANFSRRMSALRCRMNSQKLSIQLMLDLPREWTLPNVVLSWQSSASVGRRAYGSCGARPIIKVADPLQIFHVQSWARINRPSKGNSFDLKEMDFFSRLRTRPEIWSSPGSLGGSAPCRPHQRDDGPNHDRWRDETRREVAGQGQRLDSNNDRFT
jgi:hypothetical protein